MTYSKMSDWGDSSYEESKCNPKSKITEYSYLSQRKWLRMMRRYYKEQFEQSNIVPNYTKTVRHLSYDQMEDAISRFVHMEFKYLNEYGEYVEFIQLGESLKTLILCDRYNKQEPIIQGLNFDVVRNVRNRFNTRHLIEFFSDKSNALLFVHYFEQKGERDAKRQTDVEETKLLQEMQNLYDEADKYLKLSCENFRQEREKRVFYMPEEIFGEEECHFHFN